MPDRGLRRSPQGRGAAPTAAAARTGLAAACLCVGAIAAATGIAADRAAPAELPVPGTWSQVAPALAGYDGFAWYRANVCVPHEWPAGQIQLYVEKIDDGAETFFNGVKIGVAGSLPPIRGAGPPPGEHRYVVPASIVNRDGPNMVAIRVYDHGGDAGFRGIAPCLLGGKNQAISMEGRWQFRIGDDAAWAREPVAGMEAFSAIVPAPKLGRFATIIRRQVQDVPLAPQESLARFKLPEDLTIDLVLAEPVITQPLFLDFDSRGRLWVLEYRQYPEPAGLTLLSKDAHWRAVYDKVPPPPPHGARGTDRISIHEDADGDGTFEIHKTFLDGLNIATSFAQAGGGVYVLNPPYLLFYADADGDDSPDGDPEVLLEGFGLEDTHSVANSLRWGPDGWLYAAQGSTVTGAVHGPNVKTAIHSQGQNIWRYHPPTKRYEIFAEGGGNAFSVEFDAEGRVFSGHNGGNTRGFHYVQGGYFQKGFGKHGPLSNPHAFGHFPQMEHGDYARFTHAFVIYEGDLLPHRYRGALLAANPLANHVIVSDRIPAESTFRTKDAGLAIASTDGWFRPVDVKDGPDGAVYIADWYDAQLAHTANAQGGIDREHGRVYRIRPRDWPSGGRVSTACDLAAAAPDRLLASLDHPNRWQRHEAVIAVGQRDPDPLLARELWARLEDPGHMHAVESLWALAAAGGFDARALAVAIRHPRPEVRGWAWRLWFDHHDRIESTLAVPLLAAAQSETDITVLCQIAASLKRIAAAEETFAVLRPIVAGGERAQDPRLPLLVWWTVESTIGTDPEAVLRWLDDRGLWEEPLVSQSVLPRLMRRFAATGQRGDLALCARLLAHAPSAAATAALMRGFEEAYQGRSLTNVPPELVAALAAAGGGSLALKVRQGDAAARAEAIVLLSDEKSPAEKRAECAVLLAEVRHTPAVETLLDVVDRTASDVVRVAGIQALGGFDDERIPRRLLTRYGSWPEDVRDVVQAVLVSRRSWALGLVEAVDEGGVEASTITEETVRKAMIFRDDRIAAVVDRHWRHPEGGVTATMREQMPRLAGLLATGGGDPYPGKRLYMQTCGKCHALHAAGGKVGPDLTSYRRDDATRLLTAILDPSAEIREGYETHVVVLDDGRVVQGLLVEEDPQVIVLRDGTGRTVPVERSMIEERRVTGTSLMPAGQLGSLSDAEVRDLFAYLRSTQPLPE